MLQPAFARDYVALNTDGAEWLVENTDIKLIGKINTIFSTSVLDGEAQVWKHGAHLTNYMNHLCCCMCLLLNCRNGLSVCFCNGRNKAGS